jgi:hypothetical protein
MQDEKYATRKYVTPWDTCDPPTKCDMYLAILYSHWVYIQLL